MGVRKDNDINERVKLIALKNIKHVNALPEINEIKFGNKLTIGAVPDNYFKFPLTSCFK